MPQASATLFLLDCQLIIGDNNLYRVNLLGDMEIMKIERYEDNEIRERITKGVTPIDATSCQ
ncbi:hypothetical protein KKE26_09800 [bacterium]|nr:hypothetical protein [bacterium]MBU1754415.1 hypothetical protein [bacterium]